MNIDLEHLKLAIDGEINAFDKAGVPSLVCLPSQRKSYYLKCCNLLFVMQRLARVDRINNFANKAYNPKSHNEAIAILKLWLPILREAKI